MKLKDARLSSDIIQSVVVDTAIDDGQVIATVAVDGTNPVEIKIPQKSETFEMNGQKINTLQDVFNLVDPDKKNLLKMNGDINLDATDASTDETFDVPDVDFDLEIDLQGHTLISRRVFNHRHNCVFYVTAGGKLVVNNGKIDCGNLNGYGYGASTAVIADDPSAEVTLNGVEITTKCEIELGYKMSDGSTDPSFDGCEGAIVISSADKANLNNCKVYVEGEAPCAAIYDCDDCNIIRCDFCSKYIGKTKNAYSRGYHFCSTLVVSRSRVTISGGCMTGVGEKSTICINSGGGEVIIKDQAKISMQQTLGLGVGACFRLDNNYYVARDNKSLLMLDDVFVYHPGISDNDNDIGTFFINRAVGSSHTPQCEITLKKLHCNKFTKSERLTDAEDPAKIVQTKWIVEDEGMYFNDDIVDSAEHFNPNAEIVKFIVDNINPASGLQLSDKYLVGAKDGGTTGPKGFMIVKQPG